MRLFTEYGFNAMRQFIQAILISITSHFILLLLVVLFVNWPNRQKVNEIRLELTLTESSLPLAPVEIPALKPISSKVPPPTPPAGTPSPVTSPPSGAFLSATNDSLDATYFSDVLAGNTSLARIQMIRRQESYNQFRAALQKKLDSLANVQAIVNQNLARMLLNHEDLARGGGRRDPGAQYQNRQNPGASPGLLNLPGLIASLAKSIPKLLGANPAATKVNPITNPPSVTEIYIFQQLWRHPRTTDLELYSALDTSFQLTRTDFDQILELMAQKNWLSREKISPENLFTIMTPIGPQYIEMSAQNRKNPVYAYRARLSHDEILRALDIALFGYEEFSRLQPDSSIAKRYWQECQSLKHRINQLLTN
ncbi:hypothetical protein L0128_04970 [candidate division KSB1 bacterium]|nr:hypothetical protein [candidate division KSB1 bacterium]